MRWCFCTARCCTLCWGDFGDFARAKRPKRLPAVLSREECVKLFAGMQPPHRLFAQLLYGSGLRLTEGLRLRVKDVEFGRGVIMVRSGKGDKDRVTVLPSSLRKELKEQLAQARRMREDVSTTQIYTHVMAKPGLGV